MRLKDEVKRFVTDCDNPDPEDLFAYLKTLKPGNIVFVASHIDPTPQLTDEIREIFTALGSTMVKSLKPRNSWVFAGTYGRREASPSEKLIQNDMRRNVYEDWPEMGERSLAAFPEKLRLNESATLANLTSPRVWDI